MNRSSAILLPRARRVENAGVQPDSQQDNGAGSYLGVKRRNMRQDQPVLNDRNRQRAQQRADNGTEAAKQAGTAKHHGGNDLQLKAFATVGEPLPRRAVMIIPASAAAIPLRI